MMTRHGQDHLTCHPKSKNAGRQQAHSTKCSSMSAIGLSRVFHVCTHPAGELLDVQTVVGGPSPPSACDQEATETQHLLEQFQLLRVSTQDLNTPGIQPKASEGRKASGTSGNVCVCALSTTRKVKEHPTKIDCCRLQLQHQPSSPTASDAMKKPSGVKYSTADVKMASPRTGRQGIGGRKFLSQALTLEALQGNSQVCQDASALHALHTGLTLTHAQTHALFFFIYVCIFIHLSIYLSIYLPILSYLFFSCPILFMILFFF